MRRRTKRRILVGTVVGVIALVVILVLVLLSEDAKAPGNQNSGNQSSTQVDDNDKDDNTGSDESDGSQENDGNTGNSGSQENEGNTGNEGSQENQGGSENEGAIDATEINGKIAVLAIAQIGKGYEWGAEGPDNFDASGLIFYCFVENGISIPRTIKEQANYGKEVAKEDILPGDVVYFYNDTPGTAQFVGIYVGDGRIIVVRSTTCEVGELPMASDYFNERLVCIRRFW